MREFTNEIWVNDTNGVKQKVKRLDVNKSDEGLGVYINPDGSMGSQNDHAINKITKWTTKLKASSLSKHHVYIDANTSIFKSITYILPGSTFTPQEFSLIESVLYKDLLPMLGVNSKMTLSYRYATSQFQGAGMLHMHSQMMGTALLYHSAMGNLRNDWYSTWFYPRQQRPHEKDWKLWRVLHEVWTGSGGPRLLRPLGNWIYNDPKQNENSFDLFKLMDSRKRHGNLYIYICIYIYT